VLQFFSKNKDVANALEQPEDSQFGGSNGNFGAAYEVPGELPSSGELHVAGSAVELGSFGAASSLPKGAESSSDSAFASAAAQPGSPLPQLTLPSPGSPGGEGDASMGLRSASQVHVALLNDRDRSGTLRGRNSMLQLSASAVPLSPGSGVGSGAGTGAGAGSYTLAQPEPSEAAALALAATEEAGSSSAGAAAKHQALSIE
jgi:hypothetical protein